MLTDNSQGICTTQKADKILRFATLLYYDHEDAPLESSNAQNLAHAPSCPIAVTSGDVTRPDERNRNKRVRCI